MLELPSKRNHLKKWPSLVTRSYGDIFPRVSERLSGAREGVREERADEQCGERTSERTSGPFFTASFQTDLSHRPSNLTSKRNHFQITRHLSTFLNYFSIYLNGTMSRISVKIDAFSLAKSVRDIRDSFVWWHLPTSEWASERSARRSEGGASGRALWRANERANKWPIFHCVVLDRSIPPSVEFTF